MDARKLALLVCTYFTLLMNAHAATVQKKTVVVGGFFDIVHVGHIDFLRQAKTYGDKLVVLLADHENIAAIKGRYPIHTTQESKIILESLKFVDKVVIVSVPYGASKSDSMQIYADILSKNRPDIIAMPQGDASEEYYNYHAVRFGAKVVKIPVQYNISTTDILQHEQVINAKYSGVIGRGKQFAGTVLNLPTANVQVVNLQQKEGVYLCNAVLDGKILPAMCYIDEPKNNIIEVHIYNFNADLYGKTIDVILEKYCRRKIAFHSLDEAKLQIASDARMVKFLHIKNGDIQ